MHSTPPPAFPDRTTWSIDVSIDWSGASLARGRRPRFDLSLEGDRFVVSIDAPYHGDPPPTEPIGPTDGLWNHEVVELFVAEAYPEWKGQPGSDRDDVAYSEFEFSPHGHHLAWRFSGVRQRLDGDQPTLSYRAWIADGRWHGRAAIDRKALPPTPWRVHAAAVHGVLPERFHEGSAVLPGEVPDFHQPHAFALADQYRASKRPLEEAYRSAHYVLDGTSPIVLKVGERSPEIDGLLQTLLQTPSTVPQSAAPDPQASWAFITAHNPGSRPRGHADNEAAQELLTQKVLDRGYRIHPGHGEAADGPPESTWLPEPSLFVAGIPPAEALGLAREFGQAAILVGRIGEPSRLLWTAP